LKLSHLSPTKQGSNMKKTLIAAAVLAASGAAMAQSSVEIYGTVDLWVGSVKDTAVSNDRTTRLDSNGMDTSKLGFRGSEDLGGGLKANFNLEAEIGPDAGGGLENGFDRISWVGLSGGFGEVQLGRVWSAYDDAFFPLLNNKAAIGFIVAPGLGYNDRPNNSLKYISPEFAGLPLRVLIAWVRQPSFFRLRFCCLLGRELWRW
jgi:predicted porin